MDFFCYVNQDKNCNLTENFDGFFANLGGGCGGTFKCPSARDGGKGGGTEVGGKGVVRRLPE